MKGKLIFEETQTFRGTWTWYLIIGVALIAIGGAIMSFFFTHEIEGYVSTIIATLITIAVLALLSVSKLTVCIDEHALYYKYPPFARNEKKIRKEDVEEMYVRKYRAIWEYGGYGYRFRFRSGRALNVSGNMGLQLVLKNGKRVLIGTQKSDLMETAVKKLWENWKANG